MEFVVDRDLLAHVRGAFQPYDKLYWIVGGAGSGKTTISRSLSAKFDIPVYDMDAQIYGAYHGRFTWEYHPVNKAWSTSLNGLAWLLELSWDAFNKFNQAALIEYLDLLAEDIDAFDPNDVLLIDGGICNPALLTQVMASQQIVCLAMPGRSSADVWEASKERRAMQDAVFALPEPEKAWQKFLDFDTRITATILKECQDHAISICSRHERESVDEFAARVAQALKME